MPRPRRSNLSQRSRNAIRLRNIANQSSEEDREIAREKRRVSMARLRASQTQEQRETTRETARLAMRKRRAYRKDQQRHSLRRSRRNASSVDLNRAAFLYDCIIDYSSHPCLFIDPMEVSEHCGTLKFPEEITIKTEIREEETKTRCKLCFTYTSHKVIDDIVKRRLELLSLYVNLDETQENLICNTCTSRLIELSNFKSSCLDVESIIIANVPSSVENFVDLKTIYLNQKRGSLSNLRDGGICRLCLNVTCVEYNSVFEVCCDRLCKYIPEVDFSATENPVICKKCHTLLYDLSCFVENVQSRMMFNGPKTEYLENSVSNSRLNDDIKKEENGQECEEFSCENNLSLSNVDLQNQPTTSCKIEIKEENVTVPSSEERVENTDTSEKSEGDKAHGFETRHKTSLKQRLCKHKLNCGKTVAKNDTTVPSDVLNVEKKNMVKTILQQLIKAV